MLSTTVPLETPSLTWSLGGLALGLALLRIGFPEASREVAGWLSRTARWAILGAIRRIAVRLPARAQRAVRPKVEALCMASPTVATHCPALDSGACLCGTAGPHPSELHRCVFCDLPFDVPSPHSTPITPLRRVERKRSRET